MAKAYIDNLTEWREVTDIRGKGESGWDTTVNAYAKSEYGWFPFIGDTKAYKINAKNGTEELVANSMAIDSDNNIYVSYILQSTGAVYVSKIDKDGNKIWEKQFSSSVINAYLFFDKYTNTILLSVAYNVSSSNYHAIVKFDLDGNIVFSKSIFDNIVKITTSSNGDIFLLAAGVIYKFDSSGNLLSGKYSNVFGRPISAIEIDSSDNLYILSLYNLYKCDLSFSVINSHIINDGTYGTLGSAKMKSFGANLYLYGYYTSSDPYGYYVQTDPYFYRYNTSTSEYQKLSIYNLGYKSYFSYPTQYVSNGVISNITESADGSIVFESQCLSNIIHEVKDDGIRVWRRTINGAPNSNIFDGKVITTSGNGVLFVFDYTIPVAVDEPDVKLSAVKASDVGADSSYVFPDWAAASNAVTSLTLTDSSYSSYSVSLSLTSSNVITFSKTAL